MIAIISPKKHLNLIIYILISNLTFLFIVPKTIKAEEEISKRNIIILIDKSDSMNSTDKEKLAIIAGNMVLDYINKENTLVNIITFGEKVNFTKSIGENPTISELKDFLKEIKYGDGQTNMKDGIEVAINQLKGINGEKSIIVLSDGTHYINGGITKEYENEFNNLIDVATKENINIHTIGLSKEADEEKLQDMAYKTGGMYEFALTADNLYNSFIKIIGEEGEFLTLENYITKGTSEDRRNVKISSMVEEVIINVASCENKSPKVYIKVNGEEITYDKPENKGEAYRIYRFNNGDSSNIEIISEQGSKNSIIVQGKSKGNIITTLNMDEKNNFVSIPKGVPIGINIDLDGIDKKIEGVYFEKYIDGAIENNIGKYTEKVKDEFKREEEGDYVVKYVAKDGEGGIITAKDININVNNLPSYYYKECSNKLKQGEKLSIEIERLYEREVNNVNGRIILSNGQEIELKNEDGVLSGEVLTEELLGKLRYKVAINGVSEGESFAYELPYKDLQIIDKAVVEIKSIDNKTIYHKLGKELELKLNINKVILYEDAVLDILDENKNKIGSFKLNKDTKGEIVVKINPKEEVKNLNINFSGDKDIVITSTIDNKIMVCSKGAYYFHKYKIIIIIVLLIMVIFTALFLVGGNIYKNKIKDFEIQETIRYKLKNQGRYKSVEFNLNIDNSKKYLNFNCRKDECYFDDFPQDSIGCFELIYFGGGVWNWIKGILYMSKGEKYFHIRYEALDSQEITYEYQEKGTNTRYEVGTIIKSFKGNKEIKIEFI